MPESKHESQQQMFVTVNFQKEHSVTTLHTNNYVIHLYNNNLKFIQSIQNY